MSLNSGRVYNCTAELADVVDISMYFCSQYDQRVLRVGQTQIIVQLFKLNARRKARVKVRVEVRVEVGSSESLNWRDELKDEILRQWNLTTRDATSYNDLYH